MSTELKTVVVFTGLVLNTPTSLPHGLNTNGIAVTPELIIPNAGGFTITADNTNITVTRTAEAASGAVNIYAEYWHTIERAFPSTIASVLPLIAAAGAGGGGGGVELAAGTRSIQSGTAIFSASNNVSFGITGQTITASASAPMISAGASSFTASSGTIVFSNSNGVGFGANGQTITASVTANAFGVSNLGNTAGNTGTQIGSIVFRGSGAVTLSQITGGGSQVTIIISV